MTWFRSVTLSRGDRARVEGPRASVFDALRRLPGLAPSTRDHPSAAAACACAVVQGARDGKHLGHDRRQPLGPGSQAGCGRWSAQASRSAITPAMIAPVPTARCRRKRSFSMKTPMQRREQHRGLAQRRHRRRPARASSPRARCRRRRARRRRRAGRPASGCACSRTRGASAARRCHRTIAKYGRPSSRNSSATYCSALPDARTPMPSTIV